MLLLPLVLIWSRDPMRYGCGSRWLILVFAVAMAFLPTHVDRGGQAATRAAEGFREDDLSDGEDFEASSDQARLREGSKLGNIGGRFSRIGRRWIFEFQSPSDEIANGSAIRASGTENAALWRRYRVLENLSLQRVAESISQDSTDIYWAVTGTFTEFYGENWLLLSSVTRDAQPSTLSPNR